MEPDIKETDENRIGRDFLESLPAPALLTDDEGTIRAVNDRFLELIGRGRVELIGLGNWGRILFPEAGFDRLEEAPSTELRLDRADGTDRLVRLHRLALPGPGRVICLEDLTERRRLIKRIADRRRYERALIALSQILLAESESDQAINRALTQLLTAAEVCRIYLFRNEIDDRGRLCYTPTAEVVRPGVDPVNYVRRGRLIVYQDRIPRWVGILAAGQSIQGLVRDLPPPERAILEEQDVVSILVLPVFVNEQWDGFIGFDLTTEPRTWSRADVEALQAAASMIGTYTARTRALAAAASSEEKLRLVVDQANVAIFIYQDRRFCFANNAAAVLTGRPKEELIGNNQLLFFHPDDHPMILKRMRDREAGRELSKELIHRILTPAGETKWVEVLSEQTHWEGAPATISFARDITKRHEAEQERARLEKQLVQSRKLEAIGTLAGGIAHDFNNILQAISGHLELIAESRDLGPELRTHLAKIDQAVDRAGSLVQRILTFSRRVEPSWQAVDLNELVLETARLLGPALPKMISLEFDLDPRQPLIWADPDQTAQIILNLGANAGDAMPEGGRLTYKTTVIDLTGEKEFDNLESRTNKFAVLTATDTGTGMDEETLDHIFDPFFTTKPQGRGTGLGLATVHGIVKSHNGAISVRSTEGRGSEFIVFLPMVESDRPPVATGQAKEEADLAGRERILIADDEPAIQEVAADFFAARGYEVETAGNGEQALEIFKAKGPEIDLVIMDLSMPGMGGYKACQELRRLDPEIKIIIASGYSPDAGKIKQLLDESKADFISKPFQMRRLLQTARQLLDK